MQREQTLLEWTLAHRMIRDKALGAVRPFSLDEYPWLEHIYNAIGSMPYHGRAVIKKGAQIGATEAVLNMAFYVLDGRGSVFYALPPGAIQGNFAHARVDPAIAASPHIAKMAEGGVGNVGLKTFSGFNLYIRSTHIAKGRPTSAAQLSEAPADLLIIDEYDRVPQPAVPLCRDRLGDSRIAWEVDLSTPTYPGFGIDAEYAHSDQREPQIRCASCGGWHWLDWSLVREPIADDPHPRLICPSCHTVIERMGMWNERARWMARNPDSDVIGYWVPKLVSDRVSLDYLWERSQAGRDVDRQAFWNSDMGLSYEPEGARMTRDVIAACVDPLYADFPDRATWTAMGVDVGNVLHFWIKDRRPDGRERLVLAGSVPEWEHLDVLMVQYGVQRCVVDDAPELRLDRAFQARHRGKVWLAQYVDSPEADLYRWDRRRGVVKIERTKALEEAAARMGLMVDVLPQTWDSVSDIVEHLTANVKVPTERADGTMCYKYPPSGRPDHLHHAKVYCEAALSLLPASQEAGADAATEKPATGANRYYVPGSLRGMA